MKELPLVKLKRTTFKVTQKCTLKCKLCLAYIPYYKNPQNLDLLTAKKVLKSYFEVVDSVGTFSITGGEPFVNKDLALILDEVLKYSEQIENNIDIVTNGTIKISEKIRLILSQNKNKIRVIVSNYGPLSKNLDAIVSVLKEDGINYRIEDYYNPKNMKYGGWLDYRNHDLKHHTVSEIEAQAKACIFRQGKYYDLNFTELHPCSRSFWRMRNGIIPKEKSQYLDLLDESLSLKEKKQRLLDIDKLVYLNSCAYCDGNKEGAKRYTPAEQL